MYSVSLLLLVVLPHVVYSLEVVALITSTTDKQFSHDNILCRSCGFDILSSNYIISKSSPASQYTFLDTLFNREDILVQVLSSEIFFQFPVITATHSTCLGIGEWETSDSWFPGYRWKPCVCPECGTYLGWIFEPIEKDLVHPQQQHIFFGLILTNLIGETFLDSLIHYSENLTN